jgi:transposase
VQNLVGIAISRGWKADTPLLDSDVKDKPGRGQKRKFTKEQEMEIVEAILTDRYGREKTCATLAKQFKTNHQTIWAILRRYGYRKTKCTRKPGLTKAMKEARYHFAKRFEHWTLEDWKKVIWSDETSVLLGHRRGGYKVWRRSNEAFKRSCIQERWKGFSEFMF